MPSKSKKQAKLMRAVAHGWKPTRMKGPTKAVAKEFVKADKRREGVKGFQRGGNALGVPGMRRMPPMGGPKGGMGALSQMKPMMGRTQGRMMPPILPGMGKRGVMPTSQRPMQRNTYMPPGMPRRGGLNQVAQSLAQMKEGMGRRPVGPVMPPQRGRAPNTMMGGRNPMMQTARRMMPGQMVY